MNTDKILNTLNKVMEELDIIVDIRPSSNDCAEWASSARSKVEAAMREIEALNAV